MLSAAEKPEVISQCLQNELEVGRVIQVGSAEEALRQSVWGDPQETQT